jgi:hypothetical protein
MLRRIDGMPPDTIGFEASGEVEDEEWEDLAAEPELRDALEQGAKLRVLYQLSPGLVDVRRDPLGAGTVFQNRHARSFERVAVVSDESWLRPALATLSFLLPGDAKGFRVDELADAKAWLIES